MLRNPILISILEDMRRKSKGGVIDEERTKKVKQSREPSIISEKDQLRALSPGVDRAALAKHAHAKSPGPTKPQTSIDSSMKRRSLY